MSQPLVSVVMPVRNAGAYVREAIESVLSQTYANFELIILNDLSSDETVEVIRSYSDQRIIFLEKPGVSGIANCLNLGISISRGKYIARMDGDDISLSTRLEEQVGLLESRTDIDLCSCYCINFSGTTQHGISKGYSEDSMLRLELLFRPGFAHPSVVFRRTIWEGGMKFRRPYGEDYDYWVQMAGRFKFYKVKKPLLMYRIHPQQTVVVSRRHIEDHITDIQKDYHQSLGFVLSRPLLEIHYGLTFYRYNYTLRYALRIISYFNTFERTLMLNRTFDPHGVTRYKNDKLVEILDQFMKFGINTLPLYFKYVKGKKFNHTIRIFVRYLLFKTTNR